MCWSRHLVSVHEVKPVRLSIAVRRVWQQFSRLITLLYIVSVLVICVTLGRQGSGPSLLEWKDGPPLYKYIKSEILLGPPHFSDQSYATGRGVSAALRGGC